MWLESSGSARPLQLFEEYVFSRDSVNLPIDRIRLLMIKRTIPYRSALSVETSHGTQKVELNNVLVVQQPVSKYSAKIGALIGTVIDPGKLWMQIGSAVYPVNLDFVDTVTVNHMSNKTGSLDILLDEGDIPFISSIRIHSGTDTLDVRLDHVHIIRKPVEKYGARIGILLGLSADVLVYLGIQQGWISFYPGSGWDAEGW